MIETFFFSISYSSLFFVIVLNLQDKYSSIEKKNSKKNRLKWVNNFEKKKINLVSHSQSPKKKAILVIWIIKKCLGIFRC